jgi:hypothetical protein
MPLPLAVAQDDDGISDNESYHIQVAEEDNESYYTAELEEENKSYLGAEGF